MIGMFPPKPGADPSVLRASSTGRFSQLADQARQDSAEEVAPQDAHRVFYVLPWYKKVVVMLGGPLTNFVIAGVLLGAVLTLYGREEVLPVVSAVSTCVPSTAPTPTTPNPACVAGDPASPAALAGLKVGDRIVEANGRPVATWQRLQQEIRTHDATPMALVVERGGERVTLTVPLATRQAPTLDADGAAIVTNGAYTLVSAKFLGMTPSIEPVRQPVTAVPGYVWDATTQVASVVTRIPEKMVGVAQAAFGGGERDRNGPQSVVGVGRTGYEIGTIGLGDGGRGLAATLAIDLLLIASLNFALFVFNLIPLLPLDGGHVAGALWEGIKRRGAKALGRPDPGPVDIAKALPVAYAVSMVLIVMSALLVYADVVNPIKLGG
jgi:membrane-associated protease RseP (regulator of RpoE activity)